MMSTAAPADQERELTNIKANLLSQRLLEQCYYDYPALQTLFSLNTSFDFQQLNQDVDLLQLLWGGNFDAAAGYVNTPIWF